MQSIGDILKSRIEAFNKDPVLAIKTVGKEYQKKYSKGNKYTKFKPDYYIQNGYLYITQSLRGPKIISVEGLFEDPVTARLFEQYCENDCDECNNCVSPMDLDFPIDSDRIDIIVEFAVKELIQAFNTLGKEDITSNSVDDGKQERQWKI